MLFMCRVVNNYKNKIDFLVMNGLSLRVSSIKTTQNLKKNSEIQISILKLPDKYLDSVREHCKFEFTSQILCFQQESSFSC